MFPPNVLNDSIRSILPQEVKTWQQLRVWARQNPDLVSNNDSQELLMLQVLNFQDMVRQSGDYAPSAQVIANQDPIVTPQHNMPNKAALQVTSQGIATVSGKDGTGRLASSQSTRRTTTKMKNLQQQRQQQAQSAMRKEKATHKGSVTKAEGMKPIAFERLSATNSLSEQRTHSFPMDSGVASEVQAHGSIMDEQRLLTPEPISQADGFPPPDTRDSAYPVGLADEDIPSDAPDQSDYGDPGAPRPFPPGPPLSPEYITINIPSPPLNVTTPYHVPMLDYGIPEFTTENSSLFGKVGDHDWGLEFDEM
ncbi:unnamed protein product [Alternaria alternata]